MKIDLNDLDPEKLQPVKQTEGPVLIIAGPGSGKTKTLVARILYLIAEKKVQPENIMVSTFTEKAARELVTRISDQLIHSKIKINLNDMYIGTLHSIFLRILEENRDQTRLKRSYRMMDQFDQQYFIYKNLDEYSNVDGIDSILTNPRESKWDKAETLAYWINKVSEELLDIDKLHKSKDVRIKTLALICKQYYEDLSEENALDFSTIQTETFRLLDEHPEVLKELHEKITYIMVDEYQDTNTVQELILLKLAGKKNNICVVGDDDQGLYRFRGATIRNILEFPNNFKKDECKKFILQTNYRSHPGIIDFYTEWMDEITEGWEQDGTSFRFVKEIHPPEEKKFRKYKSVIKVAGNSDKENWNEEVYKFLKELKKKKILEDYNQAAFLFKSVRNDKVKELATYLEEKGIPVFSPRSDMFFDRKEVRLLVGAFIFMFPQYPQIRKWNDHAYLDIWQYYDQCFEEFAQEIRKSENKELKRWAALKAKSHNPLLENTDYAFAGLFYQLLQFPLFRQYVEIDLSEGAYDTRPIYNLSLFSQLLAKFEYLHQIPNVLTPDAINKNLISLFNQYFHFLRDGGINEYEGFEEYAPSGCVSFLTIHQSKGLEFPIVLVGSLNLVPRKQYTELDELLQQDYYRKPPFEPIENTKYYDFWRLYYTAFSRAQNLLVLTCEENNTGKGLARTPSGYFQPVYNKLLSWRDPKVKLDLLVLDKIKDVNIKKEYSFTSHILVFENCEQQYKYYKELDFAPVRQSAIIFGMLVHQTIEDIHNHAIRGEFDKIQEENIQKWFDMNYNSLVKKERVYLAIPAKIAACDQVLEYYRRHNDRWDIIQEAEVDISLVKEDYILSGKVDLIRGEDNTVEIIDFKAESKPNINDEVEKLQRYRRQLEVYAHIIEERYGQKVSRMHLYYTGEDKGNPYLTFDKEKWSIENTIEKFDEVVSRIERKDFIITEKPSARTCRNCDMRYYCNTT